MLYYLHEWVSHGFKIGWTTETFQPSSSSVGSFKFYFHGTFFTSASHQFRFLSDFLSTSFPRPYLNNQYRARARHTRLSRHHALPTNLRASYLRCIPSNVLFGPSHPRPYPWFWRNFHNNNQNHRPGRTSRSTFPNPGHKYLATLEYILPLLLYSAKKVSGSRMWGY